MATPLSSKVTRTKHVPSVEECKETQTASPSLISEASRVSEANSPEEECSMAYDPSEVEKSKREIARSYPYIFADSNETQSVQQPKRLREQRPTAYSSSNLDSDSETNSPEEECSTAYDPSEAEKSNREIARYPDIFADSNETPMQQSKELHERPAAYSSSNLDIDSEPNSPEEECSTAYDPSEAEKSNREIARYPDIFADSNETPMQQSKRLHERPAVYSSSNLDSDSEASSSEEECSTADDSSEAEKSNREIARYPDIFSDSNDETPMQQPKELHERPAVQHHPRTVHGDVQPRKKRLPISGCEYGAPPTSSPTPTIGGVRLNRAFEKRFKEVQQQIALQNAHKISYRMYRLTAQALGRNPPTELGAGFP